MKACGVGVRRGVMAADHFTQIANALFRDSRISFKAKGIFGLISTHREGWRVSVGDLAKWGREGRDAVSAGLKELERFGYLKRERVRREDGTLGEIVYSITDVPAVTAEVLAVTAEVPAVSAGLSETAELPTVAPSAAAAGLPDVTAELPAGSAGLSEIAELPAVVSVELSGGDPEVGGACSGRSRPGAGNPALGPPVLADRPAKNTTVKKTVSENRQLVLPSVRGEGPRDASSGLADRFPAPSQAPAGAGSRAVRATPGVEVLLAIGAGAPEFRLSGQALQDQGRVVDGLLDAGWTPTQVRHVVASRPLPRPVRKTVGAVIAARLREACAGAPPDLSASPVLDAGRGRGVRETSVSRAVSDAVAYRALVECTGCGSPGRVAGGELCPACLGWPPCTSCTGPTPRRADPAGDGRCTVCAAETRQP